MVARIEDERAEREALEQQRQELLKRKQKLIAENKKRREDLANLDNDLEKFIDVSSPRVVSLSRTELTPTYRRRRNRFKRRSKRLSEQVTNSCSQNPILGWNCTMNSVMRGLALGNWECFRAFHKVIPFPSSTSCLSSGETTSGSPEQEPC